MPDQGVRFSVVVPAYRAAWILPETLDALQGSDLPRSSWELLVVDDGSADETGAVAARFADRVIARPGPPAGPAEARNAGARVARGRWLVFMDADVRVHPDTLRRVGEAIQQNPQAVAVFGCYDAAPAVQGLLTEYRNLLHRFVHLRGAGRASTFWAGLGAVRRDWFEKVGGFDAVRYPRPQIEDIELGQRLWERGGAIVLDPGIQATHLKRWTLREILVTDLFHRGIPWVRLLWERRGRLTRSLNVGAAEPLKVAVMGLAFVALAAAALLGDWRLALGGLGAVGALIIWNLDFYRWLARERTIGFALGCVPLHLLYYAGNVVAAGLGTVVYLLGRLSSGRNRTVPQAAGIRP